MAIQPIHNYIHLIKSNKHSSEYNKLDSSSGKPLPSSERQGLESLVPNENTFTPSERQGLESLVPNENTFTPSERQGLESRVPNENTFTPSERQGLECLVQGAF